jgi:uncharacterized membrane protein
MEAIATIVAHWLLFAGTHDGLADPRVRARIVRRIGEGGFRLVYFAIAAVTFTLLMRSYAVNQLTGPPGLAGFVGPSVRLLLMGVAGLGAVLLVGGLVTYPESPMELSTRGVPPPTRLARITRHPFFVGLALVALVHVVLAAHATGAVFFGCLALFTMVGTRRQDRKLLASKGEAYAAYCRETSIVPFAAILAGRTGITARDVPVVSVAIGVLGAIALRLAHPVLLAWDGMAIAAAVGGGALLFGVIGVVRVALRAGHGRALATAGGMLVLQVGLAHEVVGARLYPDGPAMLGGPIAWHAVGVAGIAAGIVMTGGALGLLAMPPTLVTTATIAIGVAFVIADAVLRGGFHFFAATLVAGAILVRAAASTTAHHRRPA